MTDTLWLIPKNGDGQLSLIVDEYGRLVLCGECPCGEETDCIQAVVDKVDEMLLEVDPTTQEPIWDLLGTHTCDYQCAVWEYDDENDTWSLVSQADGHLLVALPIGTVVNDTALGSATLLVYAKTLINTQTLEKVTIGCQCRVSQHECRHSMVTLRDCNIAGQLPVWEPDEGESYSPADGCRVDVCELLKLKLTTAQLWHGGTMMGEGYYDWLLTPAYWDSANYRYQPFLMAVKWSDQIQGYGITYLNCDCTGIATHNLAAGETCFEYVGICTLEDPCIAMMLLHNRAEANGWTWHGEGALVHLARCLVNGSVLAYGNWYAIMEQSWQNSAYNESRAYSRAMCCAETSDGYWMIGCNCTGLEFVQKNSPVQNYHLYLDMPGICSCDISHGSYPDRELLLAYPEVFGIDDIVWGNDNKYDYTYSTTIGCNVCGHPDEPTQGTGGMTMYIDYRAMCFTGKAFNQSGQEKTWLRVIYPPGSIGSQTSAGYFDMPNAAPNDAIFDTVSFTGTQYTPFTLDTEIFYETGGTRYTDGLKFSGRPYTWFHSGMPYGGAQVNGCQPTEEQETTYTDPSQREYVEDEAGCDDVAPTPCISINTTAAHYWRADAVLTPDFTVTEQQPCDIRYVEHAMTGPDGSIMMRWYECFYTRKWITIGASAGAPMIENGVLWCPWLMLNINYVCTNKGFVIKGENSFHETYVLPGAGNYPQYTACWPSDWLPVVEPWGEVYDPHHYLDETITCTVDEDMHFCIPDFSVPEEEAAS